MIAEHKMNIDDKESVRRAARLAAEDFVGQIPNAQAKLAGVLQIMLYAHSAAMLRNTAVNILLSIE
jgi:hypothetical protein